MSATRPNDNGEIPVGDWVEVIGCQSEGGESETPLGKSLPQLESGCVLVTVNRDSRNTPWEMPLIMQDNKHVVLAVEAESSMRTPMHKGPVNLTLSSPVSC